jgi:putative DNA primase/helicase
MRMVYNPLPASNITPAALYLALSGQKPKTLVVDEVDSFLKTSSELRNLLNSGFSREMAYVLRTGQVRKDRRLMRFSTWGAKVLAGIGRLPETIEDRAIVIPMRRKLVGEQVARLRDADPRTFEIIAAQCTRFAVENWKALADARPTFPDALTSDRARDCWELLLAIADLAGGDWPDKARSAAVVLTNAVGTLKTGSIVLLEAIQRVFDASGADRLKTQFLLERLAKDPDRPLAHFRRDLSPEVQLAEILRQFGVRPRTVRFGRKTYKGYQLKSFDDAFARYLSQQP